MAFEGLIKKQITFKRGIGVTYWILDTDTNEVRVCIPPPKGLLPPGTDVTQYAITNRVALYANGRTLEDGLQRFRALQDKNNEGVYQNALYAGIQVIRAGGNLASMNTAMQTVYTDASLNTDVIQAFFVAYRDATANQRHLFDVLMYVTLNGLIKQNGDD